MKEFILLDAKIETNMVEDFASGYKINIKM